MEGATEVRGATVPGGAMEGRGAMATTARCPTPLMGAPLQCMGEALAVQVTVTEFLIIHMEEEEEEVEEEEEEEEGGVPMVTHLEEEEEEEVIMAATSCSFERRRKKG